MSSDDGYEEYDAYLEDLDDRGELEDYYEDATEKQQLHIEDVFSSEDYLGEENIPETNEPQQAEPERNETAEQQQARERGTSAFMRREFG